MEWFDTSGLNTTRVCNALSINFKFIQLFKLLTLTYYSLLLIGNFSFGSLQKFRSNTIVDFIENAVEHSRSGRFLFFLHRRPVMGPMRVQLLHPVSRFKQIQSLQHMCRSVKHSIRLKLFIYFYLIYNLINISNRFVILKHVRRDLIDELPLPKMLKSYLNTPYYYSEELAIMNKNKSPDSLPLNTSH
jgi:suppressor of cytokine signaling 7